MNLEVALLIIGRVTPDNTPLPIYCMVESIGFVLVLVYAITSKTTPNKQKLPLETKCIEVLHSSFEKLQPFDCNSSAGS